MLLLPTKYLIIFSTFEPFPEANNVTLYAIYN